MNKLLLALMLVLSGSLYAQDGQEVVPLANDEAITDSARAKTPTEPKPLEAEYVATSTPEQTVATALFDPKAFNARTSHWVTTFGFEGTKYRNLPEGAEYKFEGRKDFKAGYQEIWGGSLGFGGELYLGAGFLARTMMEGYYMGTLFSRILNGGDEAEDVEFAYTKRTSQLYGFEASQSLGWMFDFRAKNPFMDTYSYLNLETFVEAGVGMGWAYNRTNYSYDTGTAPSAAQEGYRVRMRDDLVNARVGAGFNLTSTKGFFLMLKGTLNNYMVTQRKVDGFTQENGTTATPYNDTDKNVNIDPVIVYALGGGYKF
jgi:hypothetical protein